MNLKGLKLHKQNPSLTRNSSSSSGSSKPYSLFLGRLQRIDSRFKFPSVLTLGLLAVQFGLFGCKSQQLVSPPHPQSGDELSLTVKPPKPIEKRLFPLKLLRIEKANFSGTSYGLYVMELPAMTLEGLAGLQRFDLPVNTGMILVYPDGDPPAVSMERNLFDIDVIYLDAKGVITLVATEPEDAPPLPKHPAKFIIEMPKGDAARLGAKIGQKVELPKDVLEIKSTDVNVTPEKTTAPGPTQSGSTTTGD